MATTTTRSNKDLQHITGHEAGAVQYDDGTIWVGNWSHFDGLPRVLGSLATVFIPADLTIIRKSVAVPPTARRAMMDHERAEGTKPSRTGYRAMRLTDGTDTATVVISEDWN
jgi:hypothetical protein